MACQGRLLMPPSTPHTTVVFEPASSLSRRPGTAQTYDDIAPLHPSTTITLLATFNAVSVEKQLHATLSVSPNLLIRRSM
ncbi:hypothetical protein QE152_g10845 [Popillia japonica]|uniref:Uncharacterized protein n=1 Tax=Popillia japonica TaxID=7064 RepID=A0AAW1LU96_POPJA